MTDNVTLREFLDAKISTVAKDIDAIKGVNDVASRLLESRMDRMDLKITAIESKQAGRAESLAFFFAMGGLVIAALGGVTFFLR